MMIQLFLPIDRLGAISLRGSIVDRQFTPMGQDRNGDAQHPILTSLTRGWRSEEWTAFLAVKSQLREPTMGRGKRG
jgi:hypothetical protein